MNSRGSFLSEAQRKALEKGREGEKGYSTHIETPAERETKRLRAIRARMTPEQWKRYFTAYRAKKKAQAAKDRERITKDLASLKRKKAADARKKPKPKLTNKK